MRAGQQMDEAFKACWTEQIENLGSLKIRHLKQTKTKRDRGVEGLAWCRVWRETDVLVRLMHLMSDPLVFLYETV